MVCYLKPAPSARMHHAYGLVAPAPVTAAVTPASPHLRDQYPFWWGVGSSFAPAGALRWGRGNGAVSYYQTSFDAGAFIVSEGPKQGDGPVASDMTKHDNMQLVKQLSAIEICSRY